MHSNEHCIPTSLWSADISLEDVIIVDRSPGKRWFLVVSSIDLVICASRSGEFKLCSYGPLHLFHSRRSEYLLYIIIDYL